MKATKNIQQLLEKVEQNRVYIEKHRAAIDFAPKDTDQVVSCFVACLVGMFDHPLLSRPRFSPLRRKMPALLGATTYLLLR
jgi:hypothetical protein